MSTPDISGFLYMDLTAWRRHYRRLWTSRQVPGLPVWSPTTQVWGNPWARAVSLDGRASSDPDGDLLTYAWTQTDGPTVTLHNATTTTPGFTAPQVPSHSQVMLTFQLTVHDGQGGSASASVAITVQSVDAPPDCTLAQASPDTLWPPNHKLLPVTITGLTDADNDPVTLTITSVRQDEPVIGSDQSDSSPDAVVQASSALLLRAERAGAGNGRVYHLTFRATDSYSGQCTGTVTVCVPRNPHGTCSEGGVLYDSTRP